ncbi:MAG TPA: Gfo/Idh/MocA family oxidoreductase [Ilumatobacteraceae bacterium]|nr:Gfo/Idh/MocA family oxidoreductase [Ilumatobacteraceae bacterium]
MEPVRLGVVGTGTIGRLHAALAGGLPQVALVGLSGLDDGAVALAAQLGVPLHTDYRELIDRGLDGVIVATPNQLHLEVGVYFARHGVHLLVEKPIADALGAGKELCALAARHGVHLLVGQHRRYNNFVKAAADVVANDIGRLIATNAMVTMRKPDSYYEPEWRRSAGAGPLLVNLIHEVDLQRAVCGEIDRVQAASARAGRGFDFDDTAAVLIHFRNGAVGTIVITESTPSPWSWEASVSEGMGFHNAGRDHARFVGTEASLSLPSMTTWRYHPTDGEPGWNTPLHMERIDVEPNDPYVDQIAHFARVIRGLETPHVSGVEGLRSLAVVTAVIEAARTGDIVDVDELLSRS